jgi:CheY-like chemotaxis protein
MPIVLCVDDSAVDRRLLGMTMEDDVNYLVRYAENGSEALALIGEMFPHIVVTDLRMPDMNGLELVESIRHQYPDLPVILSTAHGSEQLAIDALRRGAASYVPKSEVGSKLKDTIEQVLGVACADRRSDQLVRFLEKDLHSYRLENDPELIAPLVDVLLRSLKDMRICPTTQRVHIGIALQEALLNALYHGNLELPKEVWQREHQACRNGKLSEEICERRASRPYVDRRIFVEMVVTHDRAEIVVRDEGKGFDTTLVPDSEDPASLHTDRGQGLVLMKNFFDEVVFNDQGNEVRMIAHPQPIPETDRIEAAALSGFRPMGAKWPK